MPRILAALGVALAVLVIAAINLQSPPSNPDLAGMRKTVAAMDTYAVVMTSHAEKDGKTEDVTIRFSYKAPGFVRTEVLKGKHQGAVAVYDPASKRVRAKQPGLPSVWLSPDAKLARGLRGERIYEAGFGYMLARADALLKQGEVVVEGDKTVAGKACSVIRITTSAPVGAGATAAERWALDKATHLPVAREQLDAAGKVVAWTKYSELHPHATFAPDHFD